MATANYDEIMQEILLEACYLPDAPGAKIDTDKKRSEKKTVDYQ